MITIKHFAMAALLLVGCSKKSNLENKDGDGTWGQQPALPTVTGQQTFYLDGDATYVNVMGNTQARTPNFPALSVKKGFLRGYVADLSGKPLSGAYIGVRATVGLSSRANAVTNANGYYEMQLPYGAIDFYAAGYQMDYGTAKAVVGLYPADDSIIGFASETGAVKNFVLQSYGLANKADVASHPSYSTSYFGGALLLDYGINWAGENYAEYLHEGDVIEFTLTPDGAGIFGENKSFTIHKTVGIGKLTIANIPVGKYTVSAKINGVALKTTESGTNAGAFPAWGLKPSGTTGLATVMFTPIFQSSYETTPAHRGNWQSLTIRLQTQ